jgi:hypothetical protein
MAEVEVAQAQALRVAQGEFQRGRGCRRGRGQQASEAVVYRIVSWACECAYR